MATRKKIGFICLLLGIVFIGFGIFEYNKSHHPNACIVDFSKSLGGKASLDFKKSTEQNRYYGITALSIGGIFTLAGCVLLLKTKE